MSRSRASAPTAASIPAPGSAPPPAPAFFITGIGTDVGKTLVSAILTEALQGAYWKPIQAGFADGTDALRVRDLTGGSLDGVHSTSGSVLVYPEVYKLAMPASPHIAAREEGTRIDLAQIVAKRPNPATPLLIEGAGGLLVPLNDTEFVTDLIRALDIPVILVSRNYLGSINHSLLTAAVCRSVGLRVAGWIFNDQYLHYEQEIAAWTGIPVLASIPFCANPDRDFVKQQALRLRPVLRDFLSLQGNEL